jgi:hypothetical protein
MVNVTITCPVNDPTGICSFLEGAGAGMGILFQYFTISIPGLLIALALITGVALLFGAVAKRIAQGVQVK